MKSRATDKAVARALADLCDVFDIPCMFNADGSVKPGAWKIPAVRDDVSREGALHGAQGFQRGTNGKLAFFGYAPGSSGHARPHPVLVACGIPHDTWEGMTARDALDKLQAAARGARMAGDEMREDDYDAMRG